MQAYEASRSKDPTRREYNNEIRRKEEFPFAGVDGEGRRTADGRHAYFMLRAGNRVLTCRPGEERLRTTDCLEFLSNLPPSYTYVAFFFDYDVTKILEDVPFNKLHRLVHRNTRVMERGGWFPVDFDDYQIDWFPKKEFKVRKFLGTDENGVRRYSSWVVINDTGTLFQSSFIKTIELWDIGTPHIRNEIAKGKELRADFDKESDEYIDKYNEWECIYLAELMEKFRAICKEIGYVPRKYQGPGIIAETAMNKHKVPKTEDIPILQDAAEDSVASFGRYAYYGPKFETSLIGPTPAPCAQHDINSAFPAAMLNLPCLLHGSWRRVTGKRILGPDELSISFLAFRWERGSKRFLFGGFPVRRHDGSIHFPFAGKGWYWSFEARSAIHQTVTVYDSWIYEKHCDCVPFDYLNDIYQKRLRLGKSTVGLILKLIMNSHYGKLVQSIGDPRFSNTIWASFITAWTRTRIADAIHTLADCRDPDKTVPCGHDVYMIASDAIYTKVYDSYDFECGRGLGQWDTEVKANGLFIVQPGVYFDPIGNDASDVFKTRGVPKRLVVQFRDDFIAGYEQIIRTHDVTKGDVHLPMETFVGIRQALARRSTKHLGTFIGYTDPETGQPGRRTSFEWTTKRQPQPLPGLRDMANGIRTIPYPGTRDNRFGGLPIQTIPYSKDIGGLMRRDKERLAFEDQPDWIQTV